MCKFFSFVSDGNGNVFYFDAEDRKFQANPDSHTTIAAHFFNDAYADDHVNKYQLVWGEIFQVEQINIKDDSKSVQKWIKSFSKTKHFYDMCITSIQYEHADFHEIPHNLRTEEICDIAIQKNGMNLQSVPKNLITPKLCYDAILQDSYAIQYVTIEHLTSELCELAIRQDGHALNFVPKKLLTPELCKLAVKQNGHALCHVPVELLTPELYKLANL